MIYFTADLHFWHSRIILYENRPFVDVHHMNDTIVRNWNYTVKSDDYVYVLGDICIAGTKKTKPLIEQLNGTKHLIRGNHDLYRGVNSWKNIGFDEVSDSDMISNHIKLCHVPEYNQVDFNINIHGHTHGSVPKIRILNGVIYYCVSVELHNYTPIKFSTILSEIKKYDDTVYRS